MSCVHILCSVWTDEFSDDYLRSLYYQSFHNLYFIFDRNISLYKWWNSFLQRKIHIWHILWVFDAFDRWQLLHSKRINFSSKICYHFFNNWVYISEQYLLFLNSYPSNTRKIESLLYSTHNSIFFKSNSHGCNDTKNNCRIF